MKSINPILILILTLHFLTESCRKEELSSVLQGVLTYKAISTNIGSDYLSIYFPSETIGYVTSELGFMYKTTNGGLIWNKLDISSPVPMRTSLFINNETGYIFGGNSGCSPPPCEPFGSIAYKTVNGGKSWQSLGIPYVRSELSSAYFISETTGIAVGKGMNIKTSDGGKTWHQFTVDEKNLVSQISFSSQSVCYALNSGSLFKSNDGGQTWTTFEYEQQEFN